MGLILKVVGALVGTYFLLCVIACMALVGLMESLEFEEDL